MNYLSLPQQGAPAFFELKDVTIGINFHWERKEVQKFKGELKIIVEGEQLTAINIISIEEYLISVISSEMSATASLELLKAHAVISRSWLLNKCKTESRKQEMKNEKTGKSIQKDSATCSPSFVSDSQFIKWYDHEAHKTLIVCADDHCQRYQGNYTSLNTTSYRSSHCYPGRSIDVCKERFVMPVSLNVAAGLLKSSKLLGKRKAPLSHRSTGL